MESYVAFYRIMIGYGISDCMYIRSNRRLL